MLSRVSFLLDGPPTRVLLELADRIDADLIVVGSRGAGQAEVFALGDTSTKLTHRSTRPVLVFRRFEITTNVEPRVPS